MTRKGNVPKIKGANQNLRNEPYIKASLLIGMNKMMEVVYNSLLFMIGLKVIRFATREEGFEWLIKK